MQQRYLLRSDLEDLRGPQGVAGGPYNWHGDYDPAHTYVANDAVRSEGRSFFALQETTGNTPPAYPDTENTYWSLYAERGIDGVDGAKTTWDEMPGLPARISDTSFRIVDSGNENGYDLRFVAGTIVAWEKSGGGWQVAKIVSATYADNYVTFVIFGNTISSGFTDMKYCFHRASEDMWIIPGMMPSAAQTSIGRQIIWLEDRYVFSAKVLYGTAPTTTGGTWDINDDEGTIFSSKPSIPAGSTSGTEVVSDSLAGTNLNSVISESRITLDYDSGHATTPGSDAQVIIWSMPVAWRYIP